MKNNEYGRSMVEMVLVIGIIGVLAVSAMATISSMYSRWKITNVVNELRELQKKISGRYAVVGVYDELEDVDELKKIVPSGMQKGGKFVHAFGDEVLIEPYSSDGREKNFDKYKITFNNLPRIACRDMLLMNWAVKSGTDLWLIEANNEAGNVEYSWSSEDNKLPMSLEAAGSICTKEKTTITWVFL